MFYYTYVLQSKKDQKFYTGYTKNLKLRFEQHQKGVIESTKDRRPLKLIYYEACLNQSDATHREKYLKRYYGKMFLKNRLKSYLTGRAKQPGTIALISLLIITAVTLAIGLSLNLLGIDEMRMGFRESKSSETYHVAESCLEEALMRFKRDANYSGGTLQIGNGSCNINIVVNGSQRTITVTGTVDQLIRKIQTVINVLNDGTTFGNETVDWQEIP